MKPTREKKNIEAQSLSDVNVKDLHNIVSTLHRERATGEHVFRPACYSN
jgi:hypothetical protein